MIKITSEIVPPLDVNCYIITDEDSGNRLIVDVGNGFQKIMQLFGKDHNIVGALFTHGHFDHAVDGYKFGKQGIRTYMTEKDNEILSTSANLGRYCGVKTTPYSVDEFLEEKDYNIGGIMFKVIFTPGHTAGSCCFLVGDTLLSGDTLFYGSYGRCDFPTGNFEQIKKSIKDKLFTLPPETKVYPGHGEPTTIGEETRSNPINEY